MYYLNSLNTVLHQCNWKLFGKFKVAYGLDNLVGFYGSKRSVTNILITYLYSFNIAYFKSCIITINLELILFPTVSESTGGPLFTPYLFFPFYLIPFTFHISPFSLLSKPLLNSITFFSLQYGGVLTIHSLLLTIIGDSYHSPLSESSTRL